MLKLVPGMLLMALILAVSGAEAAEENTPITPKWDWGAAQTAGSVERTEAVYHAPSGSYFQLVMDWQTSNQGPNWLEARALAERLTYKGRRGRLAVIPDLDTHTWLAGQFNLAALHWWDSGPTWIGLRYWCATRTLAWVNGSTMARSQSGPWEHPWNRDRHTCGTGNVPFMGVYYTGGNWRWQAVRWAKRFPFMFVEYPEPADAQAKRTGAAE